jgi:hypothetical protein
MRLLACKSLGWLILSSGDFSGFEFRKTLSIDSKDLAERVGYSPSLFEHPAIFSATCMKSA